MNVLELICQVIFSCNSHGEHTAWRYTCMARRLEMFDDWSLWLKQLSLEYSLRWRFMFMQLAAWWCKQKWCLCWWTWWPQHVFLIIRAFRISGEMEVGSSDSVEKATAWKIVSSNPSSVKLAWLGKIIDPQLFSCILAQLYCLRKKGYYTVPFLVAEVVLSWVDILMAPHYF